MSIVEQLTKLHAIAKEQGLDEATSILGAQLSELRTQDEDIDERRLRRIVFSGEAIQGMITTGTTIHIPLTYQMRRAECVDGLPTNAKYVGVSPDPHFPDRLILYFCSPSWSPVAEGDEIPELYIKMRIIE